MLRLMCESGWISNSRIRESLISYAATNKYNESLSWLLEYTNRTVDLAAEAAKKQKRLMRELNEDPNSVSALRKIWSYEKQEDGTLCITSYKGKDVNVVIPTAIGKAKVSAIGNEAFSPMKDYGRQFTIINRDTRYKIESVIIPEGVTIGTHAFYGCSNLTKIGIPKSVKVIDKTTFESTGWIRKAREADPLVIINGVLIDGIECKGEVIIPDNVTRIADRAFCKCSSLTSVVIPSSVRSIGYGAFSECSSLTSVVIPGSVKSIGQGTFNGCSSLTSVDISEGVKAIGSCVFKDCEQMTEITIPDSVTKVDEDMFGFWEHHTIVVHTKKGSAADKVLKGDDNIILVYDEGI